MKTIFKTLTAFVLIFFIASCNMIIKEDIEPVSTITTYPIFQLEGSETMVLEIGDEYVEPGYHCSVITRGDDDLNSIVEIDLGGLDTDTRGLYTITYSAVNEYGFERRAYRYVLVSEGLDELTDISGTYDDIQFGVFTMDITASNTNGFWYVENIRNRNVEFKSPAIMADLGDNTYIIARTLYTRRISDLRYVYLIGTAEFNEDNGHITFSEIQIFEDGNTLSGVDFENYIWVKQ